MWKLINGVCLMLILVACGSVSAVERTATPPEPTVTPQLTATPNLRITQALLTATAIIAQATRLGPDSGTIDYYWFTPLLPTSTPDLSRISPSLLTATAIIAQATEGIFTPQPTFSTREINDLMVRWMIEIEEATGFSHSVFDEVVDNLRADITEYPRSGFSPEPQVERITVGNDVYVIVTLNGSSRDNSSRQVFCFQDIEGEIQRLPAPDMIFCVRSMRQPADITLNGYVNVIFERVCNPSYESLVNLTIIELRPNAEIVNITPWHHVVSPYELIDIDDDGIMEIRALGGVCDYLRMGYSCYTYMTRYYQWNGLEYVDISSTLSESYWTNIGEYWVNITAETCLTPDTDTYQVLIDYLAMGRLEEGWGLIEPLVCTEPSQFYDEQDFTDLYTWVESHLEEQED